MTIRPLKAFLAIVVCLSVPSESVLAAFPRETTSPASFQGVFREQALQGALADAVLPILEMGKLTKIHLLQPAIAGHGLDAQPMMMASSNAKSARTGASSASSANTSRPSLPSGPSLDKKKILKWLSAPVLVVIAIASVYLLSLDDKFGDFRIYWNGAVRLWNEPTSIFMIDGKFTGYIASPFNLVLFVPAVFLMTYQTTLAGLTLMSVVAMSALFLIPMKLWGAPKSRATRALDTVLLTATAGILFKPWIMSLTFGQIEPLYILPLMIGLGLYAYAPENTRSSIWLGRLLAIAAGVKVWPVLFLVYFGWKAKGSEKPNHPARTLRSMIITGGGAAIATLLIVGTTVIQNWIHAMKSFIESGHANLYIAPSSTEWLAFVFGGSPTKAVLASQLPLIVKATSWALFAVSVGSLGRILWMGRQRPDRLSPQTVLSEMALIIAMLPSFFGHWEIFYNTLMIFPAMVAWYVARERPVHEARWIRVGVVSSLASMGWIFYGILSNTQRLLNIGGLRELGYWVSGYPGTLLLFGLLARLLFKQNQSAALLAAG